MIEASRPYDMQLVCTVRTHIKFNLRIDKTDERIPIPDDQNLDNLSDHNGTLRPVWYPGLRYRCELLVAKRDPALY